MFFKKAKIITHNGSFHADEVLAVATISLALGGRVKIIRTRDTEIIKTGDYVIDVGGIYDSDKNRFDHHQEGGAGQRESGIPYSSFGLVWKKFGKIIAGSQEAADIIDKKIGAYIDAEDNGINTSVPVYDINIYSFPQIIKTFRPGLKEKRTDDEGFLEAMQFTENILKREIQKARDEFSARSVAEHGYQAAEDKRIVVLEEHLPVSDMIMSHPEILFVISPAKDGQWVVKAAQNKNTFEARRGFPRPWWGKRGEEFTRISGVPDAYYCHHSGNFMCLANSKEGAIRLAQIAANI